MQANPSGPAVTKLATKGMGHGVLCRNCKPSLLLAEMEMGQKLLSLRRFDQVFNNGVWAIQKLRAAIPQDPFEVWAKV